MKSKYGGTGRQGEGGREEGVKGERERTLQDSEGRLQNMQNNSKEKLIGRSSRFHEPPMDENKFQGE